MLIKGVPELSTPSMVYLALLWLQRPILAKGIRRVCACFMYARETTVKIWVNLSREPTIQTRDRNKTLQWYHTSECAVVVRTLKVRFATNDMDWCNETLGAITKPYVLYDHPVSDSAAKTCRISKRLGNSKSEISWRRNFTRPYNKTAVHSVCHLISHLTGAPRS